MGRYFRLELDDYSTPSFVSAGKYYFGTLEDIDGLFQAIRNDENKAEHKQYILSVYDQFLAGEKKINHTVAFNEVPFLVPAKILGEDHSVLTDLSWEHMNTWDCPYVMKCDKAESTHQWISCQGQYFRCIQTKFTNLQFDSFDKTFMKFTGHAWGYPHQIEYDEPYTRSRLWVMEKMFKNKAQALNDRINFMHAPDPIFNFVLEDVFGDG